MPAKQADDASGPELSLNTTETRFIKALFDSMTAKPAADWAQVAAVVGLKNAKCARERFRQISVRHGWRTEGGAGRDEGIREGGAVTDGRVMKRKRGPKVKRVKVEAESEGTEGTESTD